MSRLSRSSTKSAKRFAFSSSKRISLFRIRQYFCSWIAPTGARTLNNGFDLFNRKLRLTVLTDYKGGFVLLNAFYSFHSTNAMWYANQVKTTPLWDQARTVAQSNAKNPRTDWGYRENGQYWKLRDGLLGRQ